MIDWKKRVLQGLTTGVLITQMTAIVRAEADADKAPSPPGPTMAQFMKLQNEVREQRQLIVEMLQSEQQRYQMLLKLLRVQGAALPSEMPPVPALTVPDQAIGASGATAPSRARASGDADVDGSRPRGAASPVARANRNGTVAGRVGVGGGGDTSDVYVYIENVKGPPVRGKTVEIKQEGKQFSPRLVVVQSGTSVVFPNLDTVYHNVFSTSPQNSFDLGSSRAGDTPRAVTLTKPGVVEIFCNMHQKMSASILVVPSPLFTKVRPDGSFRIDNVPVGSRKVVAWSPRAKSSGQQIDVTPSGAQVTFALEADTQKAHLNKAGQAYGSYRD